MVDQALCEFGRLHNDLVVVLEALAGGNGPYSNSRVILDCVTTPANLPERYYDQPVVRVRDLATQLETAPADDVASVQEELLAARKAVWTNYGILDLLNRARMRARVINDDVRRISRAHQINSFEVGATYLAAKLGFPVQEPTYEECLREITGLPNALSFIPKQEALDAMRMDIESDLAKLWASKGTFREKIAAFRAQQEAVPPDQYRRRYAELAQMFIDYVKEQDPSIPRHADVKVVSPDAAHPGMVGSFDYGRGGDFQAETFAVPMGDMTLPLLLTVVGHEIGGHFRLGVLWDLYSRETGDPYGQVHTMHTNMTVINEGVAEQGIIFYDDLARKLVDPVAVAVETKLYILNRATINYQIARKFSDAPMTRQEVIDHCLAHGIQRGYAEIRANGMFNPAREFFLKAYAGAAYHPGMTVVRQFAEKHGKDRVLTAVREPISIATLGLKLERM